MFIRGVWRIDVHAGTIVWIIPDIRGEDELCGKYLAALLRCTDDAQHIDVRMHYHPYFIDEYPDAYTVSPPSILLHPNDFDEADVIEAATKYMEACRREAHRVGSKYKLRKTRTRRDAMKALVDSYE